MYTIFGQAYGQNAYNECTYNCATNTSTNTGNTSGSGTSPLANTGVLLTAVVTIACLIMFIAVMVRMAGRRKQQPAAQPVTVDEEDGQLHSPVKE